MSDGKQPLRPWKWTAGAEDGEMEGVGTSRPPPSLRSGADSGHTSAQARPAVLKAQGRRPPQALVSGQSPASASSGPAGSTVSSS